MPHVDEFRFYLKISQQEFLRYYQGQARQVLVHSYDGRRIQFPASALRPFVGHDGIEGEFIIRVNEQHKLVELKRA